MNNYLGTKPPRRCPDAKRQRKKAASRRAPDKNEQPENSKPPSPPLRQGINKYSMFKRIPLIHRIRRRWIPPLFYRSVNSRGGEWRERMAADAHERIKSHEWARMKSTRKMKQSGWGIKGARWTMKGGMTGGKEIGAIIYVDGRGGA